MPLRSRWVGGEDDFGSDVGGDARRCPRPQGGLHIRRWRAGPLTLHVPFRSVDMLSLPTATIASTNMPRTCLPRYDDPAVVLWSGVNYSTDVQFMVIITNWWASAMELILIVALMSIYGNNH
jgi:hypothetical protein